MKIARLKRSGDCIEFVVERKAHYIAINQLIDKADFIIKARKITDKIRFEPINPSKEFEEEEDLVTIFEDVKSALGEEI